MVRAVKKTISLPPELAREVEEIAEAEGKSVSAVVQDAFLLARAARLRRELANIPGYWRGKAVEKGIVTEEQLAQYLSE